MFHKIQSVTPLPDFRLLAHFTDGTSKNYDVAPLFDEMPVFSPLRDVPGLFEQVSVDPGGYGISTWTLPSSGRMAPRRLHPLMGFCPSRMLPLSGR